VYVLFPAGNAEDRTVRFAEFSGIDYVFYFDNCVLVEGIAQQVEHARVGEAIVVVAQGATKASILSLDPTDNFHVDKVRGWSETAANFVNTEESELAGGNSNFFSHLSISF
jgi:hypothetical protein